MDNFLMYNNLDFWKNLAILYFINLKFLNLGLKT